MRLYSCSTVSESVPYGEHIDMNQRKTYLDFLRIIAILLVVFNHTPAFLFPVSSYAEVSWSEFFMLCVSIADKVGVPLFFMISGALLLSKTEDLSILLKRRVLRFLCVLILFLLVQNAVFYFSGHLTLKQAVFNVLRGNTPAAATWFLYGYLGFLLTLPLMRLLVEKMQTQHFLYLIALHFITVEFIPSSHTHLDNWLPFTSHCGTLSNIYIYAFLGYYLEHRIPLHDISKKRLCLLASLSIVAILIGALLTMLPLIISGESPSQKASCFTGAALIPCIFIYSAARKLGQLHLSIWFIRIITLLGNACFTVMLTENIFRIAISSQISGYCTKYYPSILSTLLICCCGWICGIVAKRIPWVKTLV